MSPEALLPVQATGFSVTRWHVLLTGLLAFAAALVCLVPGFPFHPGMMAVCLASAAMHLVLFALFPRVPPWAWNAANTVNLALLGFALHFSGGILSPFTIFLLFIFVSGAGYGVSYPLSVTTAVAVFVLVAGGEAFGMLTPLPIRPADVYACRPLTWLIIATIAAHLYTAGNIYRVTVKRLRVELEKELEARDSALRRIGELEAPSQIGFLVARIAHDMRGPIGAVKGFVTMISEEETLDERSREDCALVRGELDRLAGMIDRMISYVKPGDAPLDAIDVVELLETVLSVISFHPSSKKARLERGFDPGDRIVVLASKDQLQRVFFNLVKNALEALDETGGKGRRVVVSAKTEQGRALVVVEDEGPGFADGLIDVLARGPASTKKAGGGMGLAICREIVEASDGVLRLGRSRLGGAEIVVDLPLAEPHHIPGWSPS